MPRGEPRRPIVEIGALRMIRVVSWNIAGRKAPWETLLAMDADIALLQEAAPPALELPPGVEIDPSPLAYGRRRAEPALESGGRQAVRSCSGGMDRRRIHDRR